MGGQDTAGKVAIGERGLGERVGEGEKNAKGARGLGGEGVRVEKEAEESERWGWEQVVGVRGGYQPISPHGLEGFAEVGTGGVRPKGLPPRGDLCGGNLREDTLRSPRTSPHWEYWWAVERRWAVEPDAGSECGG